MPVAGTGCVGRGAEELTGTAVGLGVGPAELAEFEFVAT